MLVSYFISRFKRDLQKDILGGIPDAMALLMNYHWPGNVRLLENVLKRAIVICKGNEIQIEHLPDQILCSKGIGQKVEEEFADALEPLMDKLFERITQVLKDTPGLQIMSVLEKGMIERAIRLTRGNKVRAASFLGINRNTLRNKMERYGIKETE